MQENRKVCRIRSEMGWFADMEMGRKASWFASMEMGRKAGWSAGMEMGRKGLKE